LSMFVRAYACLDIAIMQLKGDIAMSKGGTDAAAAYNWYSGARERQLLATRMMPPSFLLPMNLPLARYYEGKKQFDRAKEMYQEGLQFWPRDLRLLESLQAMQVTAQDTAGAKATADIIQAVKQEN